MEQHTPGLWRQCRVCDETKPLSEFYKQDQWWHRRCKSCHNAAGTARRRANPDQTRETYRRWREKNRDRGRAKSKRYRDTHKEQIRLKRPSYSSTQKTAWATIQTAIRRGDLKRPDTCEVCGRQGAIDAHHPDYTEPLDIRWLCRICHGLEHTNAAIAQATGT